MPQFNLFLIAPEPCSKQCGMAVHFQTFQQFNDPGLASAVADKLQAQQIDCVVEKVKPLLEPGFFRNTVEQTIHLKVRVDDLDKAHKALEEYYQRRLQDVEPGYYLLSFTDKELLEILVKPDEWGHFDYVLARALLAERGLEIPDETIGQLKQQRLLQLAREASAEDEPDGLVVFGELLDDFFRVVKRQMAKMLKMR
jgi:hypothetical protein